VAFLYYNTVVTGLMSQIDTLMIAFVRNGYNALAGALKAPLVALGSLFIILMGYGITHGLIKAPMQELYKFIIRLGFIYFFAMNWGNFSFYVVGLFDQGASQLGAIAMKATSNPMGGKTIAQGLQSVLTDIVRIGLWTMKKATLRHWGPACNALLIWFSGLMIVAVALCELIVSKIMLSICMATAPLFLIFTLFDKTRAFFDRWLGSLVGYSLVFIFVSTVVGLTMSLIHACIAGYIPNEASQMDSVGWVPIFLVACLATACLTQSANIAKHIGGACHTAGGGAMVGGLIAGAVGASIALIKMGNLMKNFGTGKGAAGGLGGMQDGIKGAEHLLARGEI
jgi:type IV secretion system protein VirB6